MIREKLLEYIEENGVRVTHVAKKIGVSTSHLNNYLKGTRSISPKVEKLIAEFLKEKGIE